MSPSTPLALGQFCVESLCFPWGITGPSPTYAWDSFCPLQAEVAKALHLTLEWSPSVEPTPAPTLPVHTAAQVDICALWHNFFGVWNSLFICIQSHLSTPTATTSHWFLPLLNTNYTLESNSTIYCTQRLSPPLDNSLYKNHLSFTIMDIKTQYEVVVKYFFME